MNELEHRLRGGLQQLADEATDTVDVGGLIGAGEQQRHRRTVRQVVGAAAVATLIGVTGWFVLSPHPVTVRPEPAGTVTPTVGALTTQYFQFVEESQGAWISYLASVALRSDGHRLYLYTTSEPEYHADQRQTGELAGDIGRYFESTVAGNLFVAVIPDEVTDVQVDFDPSDPNPPRVMDLQTRADHNNGMTLVVARLDPVSQPVRLFWLGADGAVHDNAGQRMHTLTMTAADAHLSVFQRADGTEWATLPSDRAAVWRTIDPDRAEIRVVQPQGASVGRLPDGATDVTVRTRGGRAWTVGTMVADGRTWYLVVQNRDEWGDDSRASLVTSISYTDASGKRITYEPTLA